MTDLDRLNGMIGIAKSGGFVTYGEDLFNRLKRRKLPLIIIATDISERAKKNIDNAICPEQKTMRYLTKEELGKLISSRPVNAIGINSAGIARKIIELKKEK
ncbi:MAG: ribosomal L7Ae/L30e/S12e/Gadd45 family protein [Bacilli bacterium]